MYLVILMMIVVLTDSINAALAQSHSYKGPIIDAHLHVTDQEVRAFETTMATVNVEAVIAMAYPGWGARLSSRHKRIVSLCDAEFIRPLGNGDTLTSFAWAKRHIGKDCVGFGEVGVRHYNKTEKRDGGKAQGTYVVPFQSESMDVFLSHANSQAKPVVFHIEPFYDVKQINTLGEVKRFYEATCRKYPDIRIVAAHNGMMPPDDLEELLAKCKNLFSDFKFLTTKNSFAGFRDLHPFHKSPRKMREDDDPIKPAWKSLITKYEDRFMFGSDSKTDQQHNARRSDYAIHIKEVRDLVSTFEPRLQQKIMYLNARKVFQLAAP